MSNPIFYSDSAKTAAQFSGLTIEDNANILLTAYTDIACSFSLAGNDSAIMSVQYAQGASEVYVQLNDVANHKTKESYSFTLIAASVADPTKVTSQAVNFVVNATILPVFELVDYSSTNSLTDAQTSINALTIHDTSIGSIYKFDTDEEVSGCTFALTNTGTYALDNSDFTLDSNGTLHLTVYASYQAKPSYLIEVTATSNYNNNLTKRLDMTITVTDGTPIFLGVDNGALVTSYAFTVPDDSKVLSGLGAIFTTDPCLFTLSGADADKFTISPTTGDVANKTGTLVLINNSLFQNKASYAVTVTANDGSSATNTATVTLTVNSDTTNPVATLTAHADSALIGNAFTIEDNYSLNVGTVTTDEPCLFTLSGTDAGLFSISPTTAGVADTTGVLTLNSLTDINLNATYNLNIISTDQSTNYNDTTTIITVKVVDKTKPVLTILSPVVAHGDNSFTNLQLIPFTITSSEPLSVAMLKTDIILYDADGTTLSLAEIVPASFSGTVNGCSFNILPTPAAIGASIVVTVPANQVTDDTPSPTNANKNDKTEFKFKWDPTSDLITITPGENLAVNQTIPQGYGYVDAGAVSNEYQTDGVTRLVVSSVSTVDVKTVGTYYVTYTCTDNSGNKRSTSRVVNVTATHARNKPVIALSNTPVSVFKILVSPNTFGAGLDPATFTTIYESDGLTSIGIAQVYTAVDGTIVGTYTISYTSLTVDGNGDDIYGDLVTVTRDIEFQDQIDFSLGSLNGLFDITQLALTTSAAALDSTMANMPGVAINMSIDKWNDIFYMNPESPGLENLSGLASINTFGTEEILYKTVSANMHNIEGLKIAPVNINVSDRKTPGGNVNELTSTITIGEVVMANWAYDIFTIENMGDVFTNRQNIIDEINAKFADVGAASDSELTTALKLKVASGNDKNNTHNSAENYTRQLMLQLHAVISGTNSYGRLTSSGMFAPANKVSIDGDDGYYHFKFQVGDKLSLSTSFTNNNSNNDPYPTGNTPQQVDIKIVITMTA